MFKTNLGLLRVIGFLEGISYILLLGIAMPLKYMANTPEYVYSTGLANGILFTLYVLFVFIVTIQLKWNFKNFTLAMIASLLPFGTFVADKKIFSQA